MSENQEVKENDQNQKKGSVKKVLGVIVNVLLWVFVAFSAFVTVLAFAKSSDPNGIPTIGKTAFFTVLTDSMEPTIKVGDLIISTKLDDEGRQNLQIGDIVTFEMSAIQMEREGRELKDQNTERALNTHRIVEIERNPDGTIHHVKTKGDNVGQNDLEELSPTVIRFKYTGTRIAKVGSFLQFLGTPLGFGLIIVVPLILFFLVELILFIRRLVAVKNEGKKQITAADEELIRQRAVEAYIKAQQEKAEAEAKTTEGIADAAENLEKAETKAEEIAEAPAESPTDAGESVKDAPEQAE